MTDLNPHVEYFVHKQCTPQWELQPSTISFFDLTFVLGGSAAYYSQSGAHLVQAGQAIFLHRGSFRCAQTRSMECAAFSFQLEEALPWESGVLEWGRDELLLHYMAEFERSWFSLDKNRELFCKGIFLLLLHRLAELTGQRKQNPHVTEIQRYLEAHFREPVTVKEIAAHMGLHPTYCGAVFRQQTGKTILQTLNLLRINRATEMLKYGGARITDVALECGFSDLYYFSRVFKNLTGRSPQQFLREQGL